MAALDEYRRKRDPRRTPEPIPPPGRARTRRADAGATFVIQEHHATALHWDFRLERDGVLVSWAVPKGIPPDPKTNHLAVHTEDHPLEYATFEGTIAEGEYGGGEVTVWDHGTYETQKWTDREVMVVLDGQRTRGRFVLFQTGGKNWMIHRMDAPERPDWQPLPAPPAPMLATPGELPRGRGWSYEMKWRGERALVRVEGGRIAVTSRSKTDVTAQYPELRELGERLGTTQVLLDGVLVAFDADGRPSGAAAQRRAGAAASAVRRLMRSDPMVYLVFDLLHLDGRPLLELPYRDRRELLDDLALSGPSWQTPPVFDGTGSAAVRAAEEQRLGGVVAKRNSAPYTPGRSPNWIAVRTPPRRMNVL
jgi:bifunctional non-homologous end joining protein LigD